MEIDWRTVLEIGVTVFAVVSGAGGHRYWKLLHVALDAIEELSQHDPHAGQHAKAFVSGVAAERQAGPALDAVLANKGYLRRKTKPKK